MNGIVVIDKPKGKTSFWVVSKLKKLTGEKKVGHAGTLDPLATGVLPICIGKATKISNLIMDGDKVYEVRAKLGERTDTLDCEGKVTQTGGVDPLNLTEIEIREALDRFKGKILQTPPMYSALKRNGVPLYKLARKGITVERKPRLINIRGIDLISFRAPYIDLRVECSRGTYVRSLVDDIGLYLKTLAHVVELRRIRSSIFSIESAVVLREDTLTSEIRDNILEIDDFMRTRDEVKKDNLMECKWH